MTAADWVKALSVALILVMSAAIGMRVTFAEVINSFQQTRLMIKGLVANFLLTPLVTLALVQLFHAPPLLAAGFLIMSACPGANLGPPCTTMAKGDLPSAISMMIAFAALSPLLAPALLLVLLAGIPGGQGLHIDFVTMW
jgi:BASS family bile acid:Na+ symporter